MTGALVIGGGLAGGALATRLAAAGRDVTLLEREPGPRDKVCGEFVSREAATYLASLGVDAEALGAVSIHTLRLGHRANHATVRLPFVALGISRRVLDEALLERAAAAGAVVRRGVKVTGLERSGSRWQARSDSETIDARDVFLATGKHDLRGFKRPDGSQNDLVAFKMHWALTPEEHAELDGHIELTLFDGGYAGLSLVENEIANLCLLVRRDRLAALAEDAALDVGSTRWDRLLESIRREAPLLDKRLTNAVPRWSKPLSLSSIPYGHVRRHADGLWRLGDQAAVIPSFSGDGMSIALHSAELAASTFLSGEDAEAFQRALAHDVRGQMLLATTLSHGLVRAPTQALFTSVAQSWPRLMSTVAFYTRVSDTALSRVSRAPAHVIP